jgi:site-specific recombinase XerD
MNTETFINGPGFPAVLNRQDLTFPQEKVKTEFPKYWDKEYVNEQIDKISNIGHKVFFSTLWMTGARVSEACGSEGFRKKDLDFNRYFLQIRWLKNRKYLFRVIPMYPALRDILQVYTAPMKSEDIVFPFSRQRAYQLSVKHFGEDAHPHRFRHSFAMNFMRQGGQIDVLCDLLGHDDVRTTMIYRRMCPMDLGKELIKINFR